MSWDTLTHTYSVEGISVTVNDLHSNLVGKLHWWPCRCETWSLNILGAWTNLVGPCSDSLLSAVRALGFQPWAWAWLTLFPRVELCGWAKQTDTQQLPLQPSPGLGDFAVLFLSFYYFFPSYNSCVCLFLFFFFQIFIYLAALNLSCAYVEILLASGGIFHCGAGTLQLWCMGLSSCGLWDLSSQTRNCPLHCKADS